MQRQAGKHLDPCWFSASGPEDLADKRAKLLLTSHAVRVKLNKLGGNMRGVVAFFGKPSAFTDGLKNALENFELGRGEWDRLVFG